MNAGSRNIAGAGEGSAVPTEKRKRAADGRSRVARLALVLLLPLAFGGMALAPQPAAANNASDTSSWHSGGACNKSFRLKRDKADCLDAGYDNSGAGSRSRARNACSSLGKLTAHNDYKWGTDYHVHLSGSGTLRLSSMFKKTNDITCCVNESEICVRQEIEPSNGKIRYYDTDNVSGSYRDYNVNVSTHEKRWLFCLNEPNAIYCKRDPQGDAKTAPARWCGSDGKCTVHDCWSTWRQQPAYDTCVRTDRMTMSLPSTSNSWIDAYETPVCHVTATCTKDDGTTNTSSYNNWAPFIRSIINCDGTLKNGRCTSGSIIYYNN